MTKIRLIFFILMLAACEKPNPTPETSDAIYSDLSSMADSTGKAVEAEKKKLEGLKKQLIEAKPYSGDLKNAQKLYFESEKKLQQLKQEKFYYSLRAKTRKATVRSEYHKSFLAKKPFDTAEEAKSYLDYQKLSKVPLGWDSKRRIANYEKETGFGKKAGGSSAPPAAAAPKGH